MNTIKKFTSLSPFIFCVCDKDADVEEEDGVALETHDVTSGLMHHLDLTVHATSALLSNPVAALKTHPQSSGRRRRGFYGAQTGLKKQQQQQQKPDYSKRFFTHNNNTFAHRSVYI